MTPEDSMQSYQIKYNKKIKNEDIKDTRKLLTYLEDFV